MENTLRNWIAASLVNGYKAGQLQEILINAGFPEEEVNRELALAAPYIEAANKLKKRLYVREGLLKTLDYQMRALAHYLHIEKVKLPPFRQFLEEYYYPNRAGLFHSAIDQCEARSWTPRNLAGKVGADTIVEIQYQFGTEGESRYDQNASKFRKKIAFGEFIDMVENPESGNNFYMTGGNFSFNTVALEMLKKDILVGDGEYLGRECVDETCKGIYFLIGPKGTVSHVHFDFTNNLLIQVYGRKRVRLVPAMQAPYMYNDFSSHSEIDLLDPKPGLYPDFAKATVIEIEMGPGDCLFIPVGWWHHITSLSTSITLACSNINVPSEYENRFIDMKYGYGR